MNAPTDRRKARVRDIRPDLQERLNAKERERIRYLAAAEAADADIAALKKLLRAEEVRIAAPTLFPTAEAARKKPDGTLEDFIVVEVNRSPKTKDELRELATAAGFFKEGEPAGRSIHATLLNLVRQFKVRIGPDQRVNAVQNEQGAAKRPRLVLKKTSEGVA